MFYGSSGVGILVVLILAIVAFFAGSIVLSVVYLRGGAQRNSKMGRFLNFDHFFIEKIIQVFNVICIVTITVVSVAYPFILGLSGGFGMFMLGLVFAVVFFFVSQLLNRMAFEQLLLLVSITNDTRALRKHFVPDSEAQAASVAAASPAPAAAPVASPAAAPAAAPVYEPPATWVCACGKTENTGKFCSKCGSPRP